MKQRIVAFWMALIACATLTQLNDCKALEATDSFSPFSEFETHSYSHQTSRQTWTRSDLPAYDIVAVGVIRLLDYVRANVIDDETTGSALPRYNRLQHFGAWVRPGLTKPCRDTRAEVLIRDAYDSTEIVFKDSAECKVDKGTWRDPYTGNDFKTAAAVQIDHVVPLKNAYITGAFRWEPAKRCHYGNFLKNGFHLRAVSGHENMSKSDRGPEIYMPPNREYACEYLSVWTKIKAIWKLSFTASEAKAIAALAAENRCRASDFEYSQREYTEQLRATEQPIEKCLNFDPERGRPQESEPPEAQIVISSLAS